MPQAEPCAISGCRSPAMFDVSRQVDVDKQRSIFVEWEVRKVCAEHHRQHVIGKLSKEDIFERASGSRDLRRGEA